MTDYPDEPLEEPPAEPEGDDSVNKPDGTLIVTQVDLTVTDELDEDDLEKQPDDG